MICKSYLVEENLNILENKLSLFYGENTGLILDFKKKIIEANKTKQIFRYNQDELLSNTNKLYNEINNISLFGEKKVILIENANEKILPIIEEIYSTINDNLIYIFSGILEKKSKLRIFFEEKKSVRIVPCYQDTDITLKKIIQKKLKNYRNLTPNFINLIIENCGNDRTTIQNEMEKIQNFFIDQTLNKEDLTKLINYREDDDFLPIRDKAILGNKSETNKLLNTTIIEVDKIIFYLNTINQRFLRLQEVLEQNTGSVEETINLLKPPIFWKDKPIFILQARIWDLEKIRFVLKKNYDVELKIKSNSNINRKTILKKHLVDICNVVSAA